MHSRRKQHHAEETTEFEWQTEVRSTELKKKKEERKMRKSQTKK